MWRRRQLHARRILITGASSGIGAALARQLAEHQARLVLTARRADRLAEVADDVQQRGGQAIVVPGDVTDAAFRQQLLDTSRDQLQGLDMLVNNAGVGGIGTFASAAPDRLRTVMEVNFFAPAELTRLLLPTLSASDDGVVVNIGSVLGHCAVPKKSEYCASKFAMHGLTDALRMELHGQGIDVLLVSPSTTASEFFDRAIRSDGQAAVNRNSMSPDDVARHTIKAIQRQRREVILSLGGKALVWADRLFPSLMSRVLTRWG